MIGLAALFNLQRIDGILTTVQSPNNCFIFDNNQPLLSSIGGEETRCKRAGLTSLQLEAKALKVRPETPLLYECYLQKGVEGVLLKTSGWI